MFRAVLDTNAIDPIADVVGAYEYLSDARAAGAVALLITHVTIDELADIPDVTVRSRLLAIAMGVAALVPTGAFVVGLSRLNLARIASDAEAVEEFRSGNVDHSRDALIAATAQFEQCPLVTNDKRLIGRARDRGLTVLRMAELFAAAGFVPRKQARAG